MASTDAKSLIQLDEVIQKFKLITSSTNENWDGVSTSELSRLITLARAVIERVSGAGSPYQKQSESILARKVWDGSKAGLMMGVVESLRDDVEAGYLESMKELIHGDLFSDFLEMAHHLLAESYKDAAAVIAGSSLEAHLRNLCEKFNVDTESGPKPKKAESINQDLAKASAYTKLEQKTITAWLDLRNKAAHGHYGEYVAAQVAVMISGIRDFIIRHPA